MIRFSAVIATLVAITLSGCTSNAPAPFNQQPWGNLPIGSDKAPWVTLIDGDKGLENFIRLEDANWLAMHGAIQADRKNGKENAKLLSKNSYTDFELYVEFWAENEDTNSGIFYRITNPQVINSKAGYEVQISDKSPNFTTASVVNVAKASPAFKAGGKWNTFDITVKGGRMIVKMNGEQAVDTNHTAFPSGPVGIQYTAGFVKFRKLIIKPL